MEVEPGDGERLVLRPPWRRVLIGTGVSAGLVVGTHLLLSAFFGWSFMSSAGTSMVISTGLLISQLRSAVVVDRNGIMVKRTGAMLAWSSVKSIEVGHVGRWRKRTAAYVVDRGGFRNPLLGAGHGLLEVRTEHDLLLAVDRIERWCSEHDVAIPPVTYA